MPAAGEETLGHCSHPKATHRRKHAFSSFCFKWLKLVARFALFHAEQTGRFNFLRLNFYDHRTEDCSWFMYRAFDFIKAAEEQRGRVLVHCVQGVSR